MASTFQEGLELQTLRALVEISSAIGAVLDTRRVAQLAGDHARQLLDVDAAYIWIWRTDEQALRLFSGSDSRGLQPMGEIGDLGQSAVGQALVRRQPVVVDDYQNWEQARRSVAGRGARSVMSVPLLVNDRPVGAMAVHTYALRRFSGAEVQLLSLFGTQVASALEAARLYDESERRRAEAEAVSLSLAEGLCVVDVHGRVTFVNPAAEGMLGCKQEDLVGGELHPLLHPEERKPASGRWKCPFQEALLSGSAVRVEETSFTRMDGTTFAASYSASSIIVEGQKTGMVLAFGDITGRKLAEERIRALNADLERRVVERTAELEAANRELEAFSYSVSHDLRAPLRSIDGFSQVLLEDHGAQLSEEAKGTLDRVRAASQRMAALIDDLLQLSRLTRTDMQRRPVDLSEIAHRTIDELRSREPERNVEVQVAPGLVVQADQRLMEIALQNLLVNAWKFTSKHEQARIEFGATDVDGRQAYFVRDDGAGFDMAYSDKLFGPFQRLHRATEFEGTGVGLATVQRVINRHGGRVWAEGEVERGACFFFTLS